MSLLVDDLVGEINDVMHSYVRDQDQTTSLAAPMTDSATSLTVDDALQISRGLVQIDNELIHVKLVDAAANSVVLEPWGRAQSGSTAVAHSIGAKVTNAPVYPRTRVLAVLSGVVQEIFPDVFGVGTTLLSPNPAVTNYALPGTAHQVLSVEHLEPGPSGQWRPVRRWRQNRTATAVELEILSSVYPGADRVRVLTQNVAPAQLAFGDDLEDAGYTASVRDLLVLGSTSRLLAYTEPSRVQVTAVESHARSASVPAGSAISASRYLYGLYRQRVEDERRQLLTRYPIAAHRTS